MDKKVIVGRFINGIVLNPLEWLLDDDDCVRIFEGMDVAKKFLKEKGFTDDDMEGLVFRESIGTCFRCGSPLFRSDIEGYTSQCFSCDEDFFSFEQEEAEYVKDAIADELQIPRNVLFAESECGTSDENG